MYFFLEFILQIHGFFCFVLVLTFVFSSFDRWLSMIQILKHECICELEICKKLYMMDHEDNQ